MKRKPHGNNGLLLSILKGKVLAMGFHDKMRNFKTSEVRNLQDIFIYLQYGWVFFENCGSSTIKASCQ